MKKKGNLKLSDLKVQSFVTSIDEKLANFAKGGATIGDTGACFCPSEYTKPRCCPSALCDDDQTGYLCETNFNCGSFYPC